jgi:anionic cell wall polymer biosynthesis LytR-Cps2A-Psr (LCP) family protein
MSSEPNHNRQKNHKALTKKQKEAIRRKKRQRKIILLVVEILVVLILAIALFLISKLGKIERQEVPLENIEVNEGISEESKEIMKSYTTIALFGLDNRSNGNLSKGRSDVIMIANINNDTKEVKLCSVFRDSYLDTGDGSFKKCNTEHNFTSLVSLLILAIIMTSLRPFDKLPLERLSRPNKAMVV